LAAGVPLAVAGGFLFLTMLVSVLGLCVGVGILLFWTVPLVICLGYMETQLSEPCTFRECSLNVP
jgi:hypothetical protein